MDAQDELGWDPKGPPQLLAMEGALTPEGGVAAWRTEMWLPKATASLPSMPLLGPEAAGIAQTPGIVTGLISQNGNPPYAFANQEVVVHWIKDAPLRPSNLRAPGKIANGFAVESFTDELAAVARRDALDFRAGARRSTRHRSPETGRGAHRPGVPGPRRRRRAGAPGLHPLQEQRDGWRSRSKRKSRNPRARYACGAWVARTIAGW
jgi:hypothetical protein